MAKQQPGVVQPIVLIGNGKLAHHLKFYFSSLDLKFTTWHRGSGVPLPLEQVSRVLLAISDASLAPFVKEHLFGFAGTVVHFSGALDIPGTIAAHPLMTFSNQLYAEEFYRNIPFAVTGAADLQQALPGLANPFFNLPAKDKAYYHALCVLGGNFSSLLVQRMLAGFADLGLPAEMARPYLLQTLENVFVNPGQPLTGPLARRDLSTLAKNLASLQDDPFQQVYRSFVAAHSPDISLEESC